MRRTDVARMAGVSERDVQPVSVNEVRTALADRVPEAVLDVATQEPAHYWRVGTRYFLDDPYFGAVVDISDLDYNGEIGLHMRRPS